MAHLFLERTRELHPWRAPDSAADHHLWETIKTSVYMVAGLVYIAASIFFFPLLQKYSAVGAWMFFCGSLLYFIVSAHDMVEVIRHRRSSDTWSFQDELERIAAATYLGGAVLFVAGRIAFLIREMHDPAAHYCFVIGSLLFVAGACVNTLQIVRAPTKRMLQLMNLTAVSFVAGSLLFTVASIPYLWNIEASMDRRVLFLFLAWQYLIGSALFLAGGLFNYWRACLAHRAHDEGAPAEPRRA